MNVSIVCEGSTDFPVLDAVVCASVPQSKPKSTLIQPDFDALHQKSPGVSGPGWQGVRKFVKSPLLAVALAHCDVLIIQVDASIRKLREISTELRPTEAEEDVLVPLREHVCGWLSVTSNEKTVIVLPKEETEAWLMAVHTNIRRVDDVEDPAGELAERGIIPMDDNALVKKQAQYAILSAPIDKLVKDGRKLKLVPELERFVGELRRVDRQRRRRG